MERQRENRRVHVTVGFAAGVGGEGLALAAVRRAGESEAARLRIPFRCRALPALHGRDVAYAAANAVASELLRRGARTLELAIEGEIAADLAERRSLPQALALPYVVLGCTLNRFRSVAVTPGGSEACDLGRQAQAELAGRIAA